MPRNILKEITEGSEINTDSTLEELVNEYLEAYKASKALNTKMDSLKSKIKEGLLDCEDLSCTTDSGTMYLQERTSIKVNEPALIEKLKEVDITDPIKTKEYIDTAVLEDAIVRGELQPEVVQEYLESSTSYAVCVKRGRN